MNGNQWRIVNPGGCFRVMVTKELPGERWLWFLTQAGCRVEVCTSPKILTVAEIEAAIGAKCDGAIGQLTENWVERLFVALKSAGGRVYSNYAVGYNNVDLSAANRHGLPVGNTPGVLTETTAEMCAALTLAAARRTGEAERFMRAGKYQGWLPTLFLGQLLKGKTVGVIGCGRIGAAYARMMVEGFKMNLLYYDLNPNASLEKYLAGYAKFLCAEGHGLISYRRAETPEEVLVEADIVSLNLVLDENTHHFINRERLALMKENAILVNASRGQVVDEAALIAHLKTHADFRVGMDVFEDEPAMKPGLTDCENAVLVPHIASATSWTRQAMASLAAANVAGILMGYPAWHRPDMSRFVEGEPPLAAPSIINAVELGLPVYQDKQGH